MCENTDCTQPSGVAALELLHMVTMEYEPVLNRGYIFFHADIYKEYRVVM
jgi:hypothetical protein